MWQAEVRVDLDAIRDNVARLRAGTARRADGGGQGRRVRARHGAGGPGRAGRRARPGSASAPSTRRWPCAGPGITAPVLAWLLAPGPAAARGASRPTSTCRPPSAGAAGEMVAAAPPGRPAGPGAPQARHRAGPRRRRPRPTGRRWCEAAAKAQADGAVEVVGVWSHLVVRRRARPPDHRSPAGGVPRGRWRWPSGLGHRPPLPAPGQLGGHADPAGHPLRPGPAGHRRLRAVPGARARRSGCARR